MARHLLMQWSAVDTQKARALLEDALRIDPAYAGAVVLLGLTHWSDARFNIATDKELSLHIAEELASKALEIDPTLGRAMMLQGYSDSWVLAAAAMVHLYEGTVDVAYERIQRAFRLSPYPPAWYYYILALVHMWQGDLDKAKTFAKLDLELESGDPGTFATLATVYCFQGQMDRAKIIVQELRAKFPEYGLRHLVRSEVYAEADRFEKVLTGLRAAGLPE
jgi:tetratricopeptide (TPR) repeat protein